MAVYKVPQDVEADDKLIGPFSFRQFIYLIIVAISIFVGWILAQIFIGLIVIVLPPILLFGALALPLRKDQPMEVYLAAVVKFYLKPKNRLWKSEGSINLVEIVAPRVVEEQRAKDITQDEAVDRFDYLARVMDSRGWSTRGVLSSNDSINDIITAETNQVSDMMDEANPYVEMMDDKIEQREQQRRQETIERMKTVQAQAAELPQLGSQTQAQQQAAVYTEPTLIQNTSYSQPVENNVTPVTSPIIDTPTENIDDSGDQVPVFNPYPTNIHQRVIAPQHDEPQYHAEPVPKQSNTTQEPIAPTSTTQVSPDILELAHNSDLSISAIAHEAERLKNKHEDEEVIISLR